MPEKVVGVEVLVPHVRGLVHVVGVGVSCYGLDRVVAELAVVVGLDVEELGQVPVVVDSGLSVTRGVLGIVFREIFALAAGVLVERARRSHRKLVGDLELCAHAAHEGPEAVLPLGFVEHRHGVVVLEGAVVGVVAAVCGVLGVVDGLRRIPPDSLLYGPLVGGMGHPRRVVEVVVDGQPVVEGGLRDVDASAEVVAVTVQHQTLLVHERDGGAVGEVLAASGDREVVVLGEGRLARDRVEPVGVRASVESAVAVCHHLAELVGAEHLELAVDGLYPGVGREFHSGVLAALRTLLGRDEYHSVGSARAVDGRR